MPSVTSFINIVLNLIWAYVFGSQGDVDRWSGRLRDWWNDFSGWVVDIANDVYDTLVSWVTQTRDWLRGLINEVSDYAHWAYGVLGQVAEAIYNYVDATARELYDTLADWAQSVYDWLTGLGNWVIYLYDAYIKPYLDQLYDWSQNIAAWLADFVQPMLQWLYDASGILDWLVHVAAQAIGDFFHNPLGFVLGVLLAPWLAWLDLWQSHSNPIADFIEGPLRDVADFWSSFRAELWSFFSDPADFLWQRLAPVFINWVCQLLADVW